MPDSSRNLTQSEWEPHQAKITRLYQTPGMTLEKIMNTMLEQDQLDASKSQYETILKRWGLRKNLSAKEWREILCVLDSQRAQDPNYKLYIWDQEISEMKIRRNRTRYCKNIAPNHRLLHADRHVFHLPEGFTIKRRTMQNTERASLLFDVDSLPSVDGSYGLPSDGDGNVTDPLSNNVADRQVEVDYNFNNHNSDVDQLALTPTTLWDQLTFSPVIAELDPDYRNGPFEESGFSPPLLDVDVLEGSQISIINTAANPPFPFAASLLAPTLNFNWTSATPFSEFQSFLPSQMISNPQNSMSAGALALDHSQNRMSIAPRPAVEESDDVRLAWLLVGDAMSVSSRRGYPAETQGLPSGEELLDSLHSLSFRDTAVEELGQPLDLIGGDDMFTSGFVRLFLYSIANNFAGLENIPAEAIMRFIGQKNNMISSIRYYLQSAPAIFSQALAEKLFKAAIEARDPKVVQLILETGLVDPNAIVCIEDKNRRRTPIERSATFRHMEITKFLLDAGADVNKTYVGEKSRLERGALECAIRKWGQYSPIDIDLVKLLLDHNAIVHSDLVGVAIRWGDQNLIAELMLKLNPSHHTQFFFNDMLIDAAEYLRNDLGFNIIQKVFQACQDIHCNQCINSNSELCVRVITQAAKRANLELVKLLVTYCGQKGLDKALAAAVRSGSRGLVEFLLGTGANINGEACRFDRTSGAPYSTTPLADAIRASDDELIARFSHGGALSQIEEPGRFEAALLAASEVGNETFLQKIFQKVPNPDADLLRWPLKVAIIAKHENVALYLLARGAHDQINRPLPPLIDAFRVQSKPLVSAILEYDVDVNYGTRDGIEGEQSILEVAAEWGDLSIIEDLVFMGAHINAFHKATPITVSVQRNNMPLVKLLIKLGADLNLCSPIWKETPLSAAVSTQNSSLINYLLELGADPADSKAIINAMSQDGETLNVIFRKFRERYPRGRIGFGGDVLQYVLQLQSDLLLDLCLDGKLDVNSLADSGEFCSTNALELVIRKYRGKQLDLVGKLLDAGGDINGLASRKAGSSFRSEGWITQTAFLEAIQTKSLPLVELVIRRGADVQKEAKLGLKRTPLQKACEVGSYPIVDLLLRHQANLHAAPAVTRGGDALQLAVKAGSVRIAIRLLDCGANPNAPAGQVDGRSALDYAAQYGRVDMIKVLWNASTGFTAEQYAGAISVAQENGHMACASLLRGLSSSSHERNHSGLI